MDTPTPQASYRRGPVILRGGKIPHETSDAGLLRSQSSADWLHEDPWRVLRIQSEFVEGFGALADLGPAVSVLQVVVRGSWRLQTVELGKLVEALWASELNFLMSRE